jgi:hypothetical protein
MVKAFAAAIATLLGCTPAGTRKGGASTAPSVSVDSAPAPPPAGSVVQAPAQAGPEGPAWTYVDVMPPLPDSEREKIALLRDVCPLALRTQRKHPEVGCRECYSSQPGPQADDRVVLNPEHFYGVHAVVPGAFSAKGESELAVSIEGCESHAENWGGLLILKEQEGKPRVVTYFSGVHPHACKPYRKKDGRDLLVCVRTDGHQGTFHDFLSSFDPVRATAAEDVEAGWNQLLETEDVTGSACWELDEPSVAPVTQSNVTAYTFRDLNRDGQGDLVVEVTHLRERSRAAMVAHCKAAAKADEEETPMPPLPMRRVRKDVVEFLFDGERFVPRKK